MSNDRAKLLAVALVVIANWILAHLCSNWAMPSEVQSAFQVLIDTGLLMVFLRDPRVAAVLAAPSEPAPAASPSPVPATPPGAKP